MSEQKDRVPAVMDFIIWLSYKLNLLCLGVKKTMEERKSNNKKGTLQANIINKAGEKESVREGNRSWRKASGNLDCYYDIIFFKAEYTNH